MFWPAAALIAASLLCIANADAANNPQDVDKGGAPTLVVAPPQRPALRWQPLEVQINSATVGSWVLLERNGELMASESMLENWRVRPPPIGEAFEHLQDRWYPLSALAGFSAQFDKVEQALHLEFSAEAFQLSSLEPSEMKLQAQSPALWAGFVNYDLSLSQQDSSASPALRNAAGLWELGLSSPWGLLTSSHVLRQLNSTDGLEQREHVRLETTFNRDFPQYQLSLRLGDSNTSGEAGSRAVFFGGVQIGRNFNLRPGFVTQPVPILSGAATSPSTVELYVDGALRQVSRVPSGPFTLQDPSLLGVDGQVSLVVRDALGRETVMSQTLYRKAQLLAPGLSDWTVEGGTLRYQLGTATSYYGETFVSGHWRQGWLPGLTVLGQAQGSRELQNARAGAIVGLPAGWLLEVVGAYSENTQAGSGLEKSLGLQYQHAGLYLHAQTVHSQDSYRALGLMTSPNYRSQDTISLGLPISNASNLAFSLARVRDQNTYTIETRSLVYSHQVGPGRLNLSLTQVQGARQGYSHMLLWTMPLGPWAPRTNVQAFVSQRDEQTMFYAGMSKEPSPQAPWGWRLLNSQTAGATAQELGLYHLGQRTQLQADLKLSDNAQFGRLSLQGAWVVVDGDVYATPQSNSSMALVEVPGLADVGVGLHGRVQAYTDARGRALITQLQPYNNNTITLNANDLPIGAEIDNISIEVLPPQRSAIKALFQVRTGQSALLRLVLDDDTEVPAGAQLRIVNDIDPARVFYVARKGQVFVTGLAQDNRLQVRFAEKACTLKLAVPSPNAQTIWRPPPQTCKEVKP